MHLKLVAALALFAVCNASLLYGGDIYIDATRDNIQVRNRQTERQVEIAFNHLTGVTGQQVIGIQIYGPRITPRIFKVVDRRVTSDGRYQSDLLKQLFERYSGEVDEKTYTDLLQTIARLVEDDRIDGCVLLILKTVLSKYQGVELERLLSQIYRLQEVQQQRLYQGLYERPSYDRVLYGQRRYLPGIERYLGEGRYLGGGLRGSDIYSSRYSGLDYGMDRDAEVRKYIQRQNQYQSGLRSDYQDRYGLSSGRLYDREYERSPRTVFQRAIFGIPEEQTIGDRRVADRRYTLSDVGRQLYRDEIPTQRLEKLEGIVSLQRPRDLELRRFRDQDAQKYVLGQDETRIPLQRPWLYSGVQNQRQLFNRYGNIY